MDHPPQTVFEGNGIRNIFFVVFILVLVGIVAFVWKMKYFEPKEDEKSSLFSQMIHYGLAEDYECRMNAGNQEKASQCVVLFDESFAEKANQIALQREGVSTQKMQELFDVFEQQLFDMNKSGLLSLPLDDEEKTLFLETMKDVYSEVLPQDFYIREIEEAQMSDYREEDLRALEELIGKMLEDPENEVLRKELEQQVEKVFLDEGGLELGEGITLEGAINDFLEEEQAYRENGEEKEF